MVNKIKSRFLRNKATSLTFIGSALLVVYFYYHLDLSKINFSEEASYNLLTVNAVFAGFLYTMLGNMVEFSSRPDIASKDKAGYIDKYFSPIYFGLTFFIMSILIDVLLLFFGIDWKISLLTFLSRAFSLIGIVYFIISSWMLRKVINQLRNKK